MPPSLSLPLSLSLLLSLLLSLSLVPANHCASFASAVPLLILYINVYCKDADYDEEDNLKRCCTTATHPRPRSIYHHAA